MHKDSFSDGSGDVNGICVYMPSFTTALLEKREEALCLPSMLRVSGGRRQTHRRMGWLGREL